MPAISPNRITERDVDHDRAACLHAARHSGGKRVFWYSPGQHSRPGDRVLIDGSWATVDTVRSDHDEKRTVILDA